MERHVLPVTVPGRYDMSLTDALSRSQLEVIIYEWVNGEKAERNRALTSRRLFDGLTFEELAEEFDLSPKQARNIFHKCENIIFKHIPD